MSNNNKRVVYTEDGESLTGKQSDVVSEVVSETASSLSRAHNCMSTASTVTVDNTNTVASGDDIDATLSGTSRNSLTASRILRNRRGENGTKPSPAMQLIYNEAHDDSSDGGGRSGATSPSINSNASSGRQTPIEQRSPRSDCSSPINRRFRNPGAAKLMGPPPKVPSSYQKQKKPPSPVDPDIEKQLIIETVNASHEMDSARMQVRSEFSMGTHGNSRYRAKTAVPQQEDEVSEVSLPSVMNRSEIFHENATAAVLALLTPRNQRSMDAVSVVSAMSNLEDQSTAGAGCSLKISPTKSGVMITPSDQATVSAFRVPSATSRDATFDDRSIVSGVSNLDLSHESAAVVVARAPILSVDAERALDSVKRKMKNPTKNLADLLTAICSPSPDIMMGRAFMVRRKNACGAIKVLTATVSNRKTLCWTLGLLPALTSVLEDTGPDGIDVAFPDARTRAEYIEARRRAVGALVNLAAPKENRIPIFHSPRLVQSLATVINDDRSESRQGCCAVAAYLSKTQENRLLMANVPGLIDALTEVIAPLRPAPPEMVMSLSKKKKYHWDSGTDTGTDTDGNDSSTADRYAAVEGRPNDEDSEEADDVAPPLPPVKDMALEPYDEDPNKFLHGARQNVFATLMHLVKEKDNAYVLARCEHLVTTLVEITQFQSSQSHVHAVKLLAHLTRHKSNSKLFVFKMKICVPALVKATTSGNDEARKFALLGLQNLSQDRSCRQEVASGKGVIMTLCQRSRQATNAEEKLAAIATLKNLTDEPANLIPMSNTPECFATLMQIAHGSDEHVNETMQYLACDALATLSHWLRKIATSGGMPTKTPQTSVSNNLFVPSLKVITWTQWK